MGSNVVSLRQRIINRAGRSFKSILRSAGYSSGVEKHDHYKDYGYPDHITFDMAHHMFTRNGIATAAIEKTITKTWETLPFIQEYARDGSQKGKDASKETQLEAAIRKHLGRLRLWQHLTECDRRSLVGEYSGLILRIGDNKRFDEPVSGVPGGLLALIEVIPAWQGQLTVSQYDTDPHSPDYAKPVMYQFNESAVGEADQPRTFNIHPDRVIIWSADGTVNGRSFLEPGYNDLITLEKIIGAGGEGYWKNAKSAPILSIDKEASLERMADAMGIELKDLHEKMGDAVGNWQKGFDDLLMLQGMTAEQLNVQLPSPEHFFGVTLQSFSGSVNIPLKILIGSQTGERASAEDAQEWAKTCMSRRFNKTIPNLISFIERLVQFGMLPEKDWHLAWTSLTESSMKEKVDLADKMADVNVKMAPTGEFIFIPDEIRATADLEPLLDDQKYRPEGVPLDQPEPGAEDGPPADPEATPGPAEDA
jgi:hypothetical protein